MQEFKNHVPPSNIFIQKLSMDVLDNSPNFLFCDHLKCFNDFYCIEIYKIRKNSYKMVKKNLGNNHLSLPYGGDFGY